MTSWRSSDRAGWLALTLVLLLGAGQGFAHNGEVPEEPGGAGGGGRRVFPGPVTPEAPPAHGPGALIQGRWRLWWELNGDRLLGLRERCREVRRIRAAGPVTPVRGGGARRPAGRGGAASPARGRDLIVEALLSAVSDPETSISTSAIMALGKAGAEEVVPVLVKMLSPDIHKRRTPRPSAILALGMAGRGDRDVAQFLLHCLRDSRRKMPEPVLLACALHHTRDLTAIPGLFSRAKDDGIPDEVRGICLLGLGRIQGDLLYPELLRVLKGPAVRSRRRPVLQAFAAAALHKAGRAEAVPALVRTLKDGDRFVEMQAIVSLGGLAAPTDKAAVTALRDLVRTSQVPLARGLAAVALGEIGAGDAMPDLRRFLAERLEPTTPFAALGLGLMARAGAEPGVRETCLHALREALVGERGDEPRGAIAVALGAAGDTESVPALRRLLEYSDVAGVRVSAALGLGYIGSEDAVPPLRDVLRRPCDSVVRHAAAMALGMIGDREASTLLFAQLKKGETEAIRAGAALGLGYLITAAEAKPLVEILRNRNAPATVRNLAAVALGFIIDERPADDWIGDHLCPELYTRYLSSLCRLY